MNIFYLCDFNEPVSSVLRNKQILQKLGSVFVYGIEYNSLPYYVNDSTNQYIIDHKIDLIVGVGMAAYYAAKVAYDTGVMFVMCNPIIDAPIDLSKLSHDEFIEEYIELSKHNKGLILLDAGADGSYTNEIQSHLGEYYYCHLFGDRSKKLVNLDNQRTFDHLDDALDTIINHVRLVEDANGL